MSVKFFTIKFFLDDILSRSTNRGGAHYVGPFKSFWVSSASGDFDCNIVINPKDDSSDGLPLRLNQCQALEEKAEEACIETKVAQPGAWIKITFAQDDSMSVGSVAVTVNGRVSIDEGIVTPQSKVTVTSVATLVLPADENRLVADFQFKSGSGKVYVGSLAELNDADFANLCHDADAGEDFDIPGPAAVYMKSVGGSNIYSLKQGRKV